MQQHQPENNKEGFRLKLEVESSSEQRSSALRWVVVLVIVLVGSPSLVELVRWVVKGVG